MSEENVETFQRGIDGFNRGDLSAMPELLDADVEWHVSLLTMFGGEAAVFRGHEEYVAYFRELEETFAEFRIEIEEIEDLGERLVAVGRFTGRGKASGAPFETPVGYLIEFKGGKVTRMDDYLDPAEALAVARLRE